MGLLAACKQSSEAATEEVTPERGAPKTDGGTDASAEGAAASVRPCSPKGSSELVYPGASCSVTSDGTTIPLLGSCAPGKWACIDFGTAREAACVGAKGPTKETCTPASQEPADENCDGAIDEGCACALGTSRKCGLGICAVDASQTCVDGGTGPMWGPCVGPKPKDRDCTSALDNDCNGTPDRDDLSCRCVGPAPATTAPGVSVSCGQFGSVGLCGPVQRQCIIAKDKKSATWDRVCLGGTRICNSPIDNNCNNVIDANEPGQLCIPPEEVPQEF